MSGRPTFQQGEIVLARFPFTDLSAAKVRPVVVLRDLVDVTGSDDVIVCAISSRPGGPQATTLRLAAGTTEFLPTNLKGTSEIHVAKLFTCDRRIIARRLGGLAGETLEKTRRVLQALFAPSDQ